MTLNAVPTAIRPRILATAINEDDNAASLDLAMDVAGYFELTTVEAREIASEVGRAVSKWREEAALRGMSMAETDRMASAFVHRDMEMALSR
jgi:serine/threonine-protein kinase HipA